MNLLALTKVGNLDKIKEYLIDHPNSINPLMTCSSEYGHLEVVKFLIENGASVHFHHDSALRRSAEYGHLEVVKLLIKNGADIHINDDYPLVINAKKGNLNAVKYLIENGANIHAHNDYPLVVSALNDHKEIVQFLLCFYDEHFFFKLDNFPKNIKKFVKKFNKDRSGTIRKCRNKFMKENLKWFLYIVVICDGYYEITNNVNVNLQKFVNIITRLPMELQMTICNRIIGNNESIISDLDIEYGMKNLYFTPLKL